MITGGAADVAPATSRDQAGLCQIADQTVLETATGRAPGGEAKGSESSGQLLEMAGHRSAVPVDNAG